MSEMVERVARAICKVHGFYEADMIVSGRDGGPVPYWTEYEADARAAIEAMRPTTNRMDVAGVTYLRENQSDASGCFEEMISAALQD